MNDTDSLIRIGKDLSCDIRIDDQSNLFPTSLNIYASPQLISYLNFTREFINQTASILVPKGKSIRVHKHDMFFLTDYQDYFQILDLYEPQQKS